MIYNNNNNNNNDNNNNNNNNVLPNPLQLKMAIRAIKRPT